MCLAVVAGLDPIAHLPPDLVSRVKVLVDDDRHTEAGRLIPGDVPDLFAFSGTPDQGAAQPQAQALIDAGAARVEFGAPRGLTDGRGVHLLGTAVLPQLRW
ncbi:hypothetical protein [Thermocatellispora tengchongensis]|uniref:hypothetical protein n=1 Tax=Thermocatellispora tengchongensis TaxID=1073253 RepID=UPI00362FCB63